MMAEKPKGRPPIPLDYDLIYNLARIHCSETEIANIIGVKREVLCRRCGDIMQKARDEGKMSLRRAMYHKAINEGNPVMQIWLSKNWLGYQDQPTAADANQPLPWTDDLTPAQITQESQDQDTDLTEDDLAPSKVSVDLTHAALDSIRNEVDATIRGDYSNE